MKKKKALFFLKVEKGARNLLLLAPCSFLLLIRRFVDSFDSTTAGVIHILESSIPFQGNGRRASYAGLTGYAKGSTVRRKMLGKDAAILVRLVVLRRINGEALGSMCHLFVAHGLGGNLLQSVNP